jgi:hypothetical protein
VIIPPVDGSEGMLKDVPAGAMSLRTEAWMLLVLRGAIQRTGDGGRHAGR